MPKEPSNRHSAYNALFIFSEFFSTSIKWAVAAVLLGFVFNKDFEKNNEVTATFFSALGVGVIDSMLRLRFSSYKHYVRMPLDLLFEYSESFVISFIAMIDVFKWSRSASFSLAVLFSIFPSLIELDVYSQFKDKIHHLYYDVFTALMHSLVLLTLFVVINDFHRKPAVEQNTALSLFLSWLALDTFMQLMITKFLSAKSNTLFHVANSTYEIVSTFLLTFEVCNELIVKLQKSDNFPSGYFALTALLSLIVASIRGVEQFHKPTVYDVVHHNFDDMNNDDDYQLMIEATPDDGSSLTKEDNSFNLISFFSPQSIVDNLQHRYRHLLPLSRW